MTDCESEIDVNDAVQSLSTIPEPDISPVKTSLPEDDESNVPWHVRVVSFVRRRPMLCTFLVILTTLVLDFTFFFLIKRTPQIHTMSLNLDSNKYDASLSVSGRTNAVTLFSPVIMTGGECAVSFQLDKLSPPELLGHATLEANGARSDNFDVLVGLHDADYTVVRSFLNELFSSERSHARVVFDCSANIVAKMYHVVPVTTTIAIQRTLRVRSLQIMRSNHNTDINNGNNNSSLSASSPFSLSLASSSIREVSYDAQFVVSNPQKTERAVKKVFGDELTSFSVSIPSSSFSVSLLDSSNESDSASPDLSVSSEGISFDLLRLPPLLSTSVSVSCLPQSGRQQCSLMESVLRLQQVHSAFSSQRFVNITAVSQERNFLTLSLGESHHVRSVSLSPLPVNGNNHGQSRSLQVQDGIGEAADCFSLDFDGQFLSQNCLSVSATRSLFSLSLSDSAGRDVAAVQVSSSFSSDGERSTAITGTVSKGVLSSSDVTLSSSVLSSERDRDATLTLSVTEGGSDYVLTHYSLLSWTDQSLSMNGSTSISSLALSPLQHSSVFYLYPEYNTYSVSGRVTSETDGEVASLSAGGVYSAPSSSQWDVKVTDAYLSLFKSDNYTMYGETRYFSQSVEEEGRVLVSFSLFNSAGTVSASSPHSALFYSLSPSSVSVFAQTSLSASVSLSAYDNFNLNFNHDEELIVHTQNSGDFLVYLAEKSGTERDVLSTEQGWSLSAVEYRDRLLANTSFYSRDTARSLLPPVNGGADTNLGYFSDVTALVRGATHYTSPSLWDLSVDVAFLSLPLSVNVPMTALSTNGGYLSGFVSVSLFDELEADLSLFSLQRSLVLSTSNRGRWSQDTLLLHSELRTEETPLSLSWNLTGLARPSGERDAYAVSLSGDDSSLSALVSLSFASLYDMRASLSVSSLIYRGAARGSADVLVAVSLLSPESSGLFDVSVSLSDASHSLYLAQRQRAQWELETATESETQISLLSQVYLTPVLCDFFNWNVSVSFNDNNGDFSLSIKETEYGEGDTELVSVSVEGEYNQPLMNGVVHISSMSYSGFSVSAVYSIADSLSSGSLSFFHTTQETRRHLLLGSDTDSGTSVEGGDTSDPVVSLAWSLLDSAFASFSVNELPLDLLYSQPSSVFISLSGALSSPQNTERSLVPVVGQISLSLYDENRASVTAFALRSTDVSVSDNSRSAMDISVSAHDNGLGDFSMNLEIDYNRESGDFFMSFSEDVNVYAMSQSDNNQSPPHLLLMTPRQRLSDANDPPPISPPPISPPPPPPSNEGSSSSFSLSLSGAGTLQQTSSFMSISMNNTNLSLFDEMYVMSVRVTGQSADSEGSWGSGLVTLNMEMRDAMSNDMVMTTKDSVAWNNIAAVTSFGDSSVAVVTDTALPQDNSRWNVSLEVALKQQTLSVSVDNLPQLDVNMPSRAPSAPPTAVPSLLPGRTHSPSRSPSRAPTFSPTRLPTISPSRRPSAVPTLAPTRAAVEFSVRQPITGVNITAFQRNYEANVVALKLTIAQSMSGVSVHNIRNLTVTAATRRLLSSMERGSALLRGSDRNTNQRLLTDSSSGIVVTYSIVIPATTQSNITYETLSQQLEESVESGSFDSALQTNVVAQGGSSELAQASSGPVETTNLAISTDDSSDDKVLPFSQAVLIAIIVVGGLVLLSAVVAAVYCLYIRDESSTTTPGVDGFNQVPPSFDDIHPENGYQEVVVYDGEATAKF